MQTEQKGRELIDKKISRKFAGDENKKHEDGRRIGQHRKEERRAQ